MPTLWRPLLPILLRRWAGQEVVLVFDPTPHRADWTVLWLGIVLHRHDANDGQRFVETVTGLDHIGFALGTRAELEEAVFKTTEHDTGGTVTLFPTTTPNNPAQYVVEGYGIAEPASGQRAFEVLMGDRLLPARPDEDEFFAADSMLRDAPMMMRRMTKRNTPPIAASARIVAA